jgi:ribonuclease D
MVDVLRDTASIVAFCEEAMVAPWVALDTEFRREDSYWPEWCLLQLAIPSRIVLIDPIEQAFDWQPVSNLLTAPVLKLMHAPRQDLELLYYYLKVIPQPLFDTQLAASFCGFGDYVGYDKLVGALLGKRVDKSERVTDWSKRPLTQAQLDYAANDVRYLEGLYTSLSRQLEQKQRMAWFDAEMQELCRVETFTPNPLEAWQRMRLGTLPEVTLARVQHLAAWREENALRLNAPRAWLMKDDALIQLAKRRYPSIREVRSQLASTYRDDNDLIEGLHALLKLPLTLLQPLPVQAEGSLNPEETLLLEGVKLLHKYVALREGIAPRLLATSKDLHNAVRGESSRLQQPWVKPIFGDVVDAFLHGRMALHVDKQLSLIEISSCTLPAKEVNPK